MSLVHDKFIIFIIGRNLIFLEGQIQNSEHIMLLICKFSVHICQLELTKDQLLKSQMNICLIFFRTFFDSLFLVESNNN